MSEPTKVTVYVAPEGTWLEIVGEDDALDLTRPVRVVFERDYAKLAQALTLATQRAEAAEAAEKQFAGAAQRWEDAYYAERAERDALRKVVKAVRATDFDGIVCADVDGVNWFDALDAALAVQPTTEGE